MSVRVPNWRGGWSRVVGRACEDTQVTSNLFDDASESAGPQIESPSHLRRPTADQILDALDPEQREVALALSGPVVVWAGAGNAASLSCADV